VNRDEFAAQLGRPAWMADALCIEYAHIVDFFPRSEAACAPAVAICRRCLVRAECLAFALGDPVTVRYGIWGGTTPKERKSRGLP
jgi:WhiB family redox-sensing transcriptional regulator